MNKRIALVILCLTLSACGLIDFTPQVTATPLPSNTPTDQPPFMLTEAARVPVFTYPESTSPMIPTYTLTPITDVYQAFEHGFMIYAEGDNCLYAYADGIIIPQEFSSLEMGMYHYCIEFDDLPAAPAGAPADPFGRVWARYAEMPTYLGTAVGTVERYQTLPPRSDPVVMGGVFYSGIMTLPDGRQLYCGTRGATAGQCELREPPTY